MNLRGVEVQLDKEEWQVKEFQVSGIVELGVVINLKEETYKYDPSDPKNTTILGFGPFVKSYFGSSRGVLIFRSPITRGLHVSTAGGVGYSMIKMGAYFVIIKGKAKEPVLVGIEGDQTGVKDVWFEYLNENQIEKNSFEFSEWLSNKYNDELKRGDVIFAGHPHALSSSVLAIKRSDLGPIPDLFGRGGAGYALLKHNVKAILGYGDFEPEEILDFNLLINEILGSPSVVVKTTAKYRFDPELGTGGTFGVNYVHYKDLVPMLVYDTIYMDYEERMRIVKRALEDFWSPFQECIREKAWRTCGEPCPAVCKKMWRKHKVDYEPFHALGPYVGNFNLERASRFVERVDALGIDAIEVGHVIGFILKSVMDGLLKPEEVGIDARPTWEEDTSDFIDKILKQMERGEGLPYEILTKGLRKTIKKLNRELSDRVTALGRRFNDLVPYASFGDEGYMTPNYYWSPGVVAPVYVLGRYWINYSPTFDEPKEFAYQCYIRAINELMIDNAGFCRFHRKWAEKVLREAYLRLGINISDVSAEVYREIAIYNRKAGAEPQPWESKKAIDIVKTIAKVMKRWDWVNRFERGEALEWWREFKEEFDLHVFNREG